MPRGPRIRQTLTSGMLSEEQSEGWAMRADIERGSVGKQEMEEENEKKKR
jgi:hypothetical protein